MGVVTYCEKCGGETRPYDEQGRQPCRNCLEAEIERLRAESARFRLERDMLALNAGRKDPSVFVIYDAHGDIVTVSWNKMQNGNETPLRFPSYYHEAAEGKLG